MKTKKKIIMCMLIILGILILSIIYLFVLYTTDSNRHHVDIATSEKKFENLHIELQRILDKYNLKLDKKENLDISTITDTGVYRVEYVCILEGGKTLNIYLSNEKGKEHFTLSILTDLMSDASETKINLNQYPYFFEIAKILSNMDIENKEYTDILESIYQTAMLKNVLYPISTIVPINWDTGWMYSSGIQVTSEFYYSDITFTGILEYK